MDVDLTAWRDRRVLMTGAAGFLGTRVGEMLADAGARVLGLDIAWETGWGTAALRAGVVRVDGDVRDQRLVGELLREHRPDTVIHLAAQAVVGPANDDPIPTFETNIGGTWTLLEACRHSTAEAILVASSDKAYGDAAGAPYDEDMPLRARSPYEVSKASADLLAQAYAATYGLPVVISRCGNLYGGGDLHWSRIVPGTIRSVLEGTPPVIRSDGTHVRDFLYIEDAAAGMLAALQALRERSDLAGEAFNLSAEEPVAVRDLVGMILRLMGDSSEPIVLGTARNEIREQRVTAEKARAVLGWKAIVPLEEALARTIEWYREHLRAP